MHAWGSAIVRIKAFTGCRTSGYRQNPGKARTTQKNPDNAWYFWYFCLPKTKGRPNFFYYYRGILGCFSDYVPKKSLV